MRRRLGASLFVGGAVILIPLLGCATQFQGSATIRGGPRGCMSRCEAASLRMSQFVFVGEYSTACVCELDPARVRRADAEHGRGVDSPSSGATIAAAAGVMIRMREAQQQGR